MNSTAETRARVFEYVSLLASAEQQMHYEKDVPHVFVPAEIVEGFASDIFHPKNPEFISAISESELKDISRLYGLVCSASEGISAAGVHSMADALKVPEWRSMMTYAKMLMQDLHLPNKALAQNRQSCCDCGDFSSRRHEVRFDEHRS